MNKATGGTVKKQACRAWTLCATCDHVCTHTASLNPKQRPEMTLNKRMNKKHNHEASLAKASA